MKHYSLIDVSHDLEQFGFIWLTGEACPYNMRVLYDLTEEGVEIWQEFTLCKPMARNMNSGAVRSCLISHSAIVDLYTFCILEKRGVDVVVRTGYGRQQGLYALTFDEWNGEQGQELHDAYARWSDEARNPIWQTWMDKQSVA